MKVLIFFLLALPCLGQKLNPFQVELNDSLKKVVRLYIAKEEKQEKLSFKKNTIYARFNPGKNQWFIGASTNHLKGYEYPPVYLSKVDQYWVEFHISAMDKQFFTYPKEYIEFYKKNVLSLLEEVEPPLMETVTFTQNGKSWKVTRPVADDTHVAIYRTGSSNKFEQWVVTFPEDGPIDIKITL